VLSVEEYREEYGDLRRRLAVQRHPGGVGAYTSGKRAFVAGVFARSGIILDPR
jgi:GrpB-like predicted nucleotidyltransferase (UPF0157 family)